jgi:2-polyprenyl-3-methyl-5-hydroxy-6-metoxy-1,4-benzoquinol methylase
LSEIQKWDPTLTSIKCDHCLSVYFAQNGVFHLYPYAEKNHHVEIHDRLSSFAAILDESTNLKRIIPELFFKQISNTKSKRVFLDAGCGYGDLSIAACEFFDEVIAIDAGDQELEYLAARIREKNIKNIHVFKTSLMNLPFVAEQFSGIGCIQVLEHVSDAKKALDNLYSNLSPGGLLYLSTPNKYSIKPEAHTKLWGIGYLPPKMALIYARLFRRDKDYKSIFLFSINKLRILLFPYFGKNIKFIRSGYHQSFLGKLAKWSWEKPLLKFLAYFLVADIEVVAFKE